VKVNGRDLTRFWKSLVAGALIVLGSMAWYGLHRDIQSNANPCFSNAEDVRCQDYLCHAAAVIHAPPTRLCLRLFVQEETR